MCLRAAWLALRAPARLDLRLGAGAGLRRLCSGARRSARAAAAGSVPRRFFRRLEQMTSAAGSPDFASAPQAFREAFRKRYAGLDDLLSSTASSSGGDCRVCEDLLASTAYSPAGAKATARRESWVHAALLGLLVVLVGVAGYLLWKRFGAKGRGGGALGAALLSSGPGAAVILDGASAVPRVAAGAHVVCYHATWCSYCKQFVPLFHSVASSFASSPDVAFSVCNIDLVPAEARAKYGLNGLPTTVLFRADGSYEKRVGAITEEELRELVRG